MSETESSREIAILTRTARILAVRWLRTAGKGAEPGQVDIETAMVGARDEAEAMYAAMDRLLGNEAAI